MLPILLKSELLHRYFSRILMAAEEQPFLMVVKWIILLKKIFWRLILFSKNSDLSCFTGRIGVVKNFKKFVGKYLWCSLSLITFQAASWTTGWECSPPRIFSSFFRNVSEQLIQLIRQINFCMLLQEFPAFLQYLLFTFM